MTTLTLQLPDADMDALTPEERLQRVECAARVEMVIKMWQADEISEGYAGDLLGKTRNEFYAILAEKGIPRIKASRQELAESYRRFKAALR